MSSVEIKVPDIGDFDEVEIIEILVSEGQQVAVEEPLITLESDKATMDIPAPADGVIGKMLVKVGEMVSEGTPIALLAAAEAGGEVAPADKAATADKTANLEKPAKAEAADRPKAAKAVKETPSPSTSEGAASSKKPPTAATADHGPPPTLPPPVERADAALPHASPGIRRFARELGAQLSEIRGSGAKGRILKADVKAWVKQRLSAPAQSVTAGGGIPPPPEIDFSKFGAVETMPLSRIKKLSGPHLRRSWLNIPHVTHHDEADITELENFRQSLKVEAEKEGIRITLLGFVIKILARGLKKFPTFNASLHADGASLVIKKYYNIGIAVDTPQGLVVPVIREVDRKTIFDLAREMGELSLRAREGKLKIEDLQGGCMSISSLGGIGGNAFTPIVNAPEVAILGITRARMTPVWDGAAFQPRLMLPLDLSYDHRVIDGAEAARFAAFLTQSFGDVRRLAL